MLSLLKLTVLVYMIFALILNANLEHIVIKIIHT